MATLWEIGLWLKGRGGNSFAFYLLWALFFQELKLIWTLAIKWQLTLYSATFPKSNLYGGFNTKHYFMLIFF